MKVKANLNLQRERLLPKCPTGIAGFDEIILGGWPRGAKVVPQYHEHIAGLCKRPHGAGKYAGSGMGLAIFQKIAERYKGCIWMESEPG